MILADMPLLEEKSTAGVAQLNRYGAMQTSLPMCRELGRDTDRLIVVVNEDYLLLFDTRHHTEPRALWSTEIGTGVAQGTPWTMRI